MTIELRIILYIYLFFLLIFGLFSIFNLYHIFKYGLTRFLGWFSAISYIVGIAVILIFTYVFIQDINWSQQIKLFETTPNNIITPYAY